MAGERAGGLRVPVVSRVVGEGKNEEHWGFDEDARSVARFIRRYLAESQRWAALFAGRDLPDADRDAVVAGLHRFTGLDRDYLLRANPKVDVARFRREILRERSLVVGRLDSRFTGIEEDAVGELPTGDPMASGISGAFVSAFHTHLSTSLGVTMDRDYVVMSPEAGRSWKRPDSERAAFDGFVDTLPALARGMADNPELRVFVASGRTS